MLPRTVNGLFTWLEAVTYQLPCAAHFWRRGQDKLAPPTIVLERVYCAECLFLTVFTSRVWLVVLFYTGSPARVWIACRTSVIGSIQSSGQGVKDLPESSWLFSAAESGFHSRWATLSGWWFFCVCIVNLVLVSGLCLQCYFRLRVE